MKKLMFGLQVAAFSNYLQDEDYLTFEIPMNIWPKYIPIQNSLNQIKIKKKFFIKKIFLHFFKEKILDKI